MMKAIAASWLLLLEAVVGGDVLLHVFRHRTLGIFSVQDDEQHVLVSEVVVLRSASIGPRLSRQRQVDVVVASHVEEGGLELGDDLFALLPLLVHLFLSRRVPLY